jgi:hypothetical protein
MNATVTNCPACGAPPTWAGPIALPSKDGRPREAALLVSWLCGHRALFPLDEGAARRVRAIKTGHPPRECGGGDHDRPYSYRAPTADDPVPFDRGEYARLLVLRGRARAGAFADDGYVGVATRAGD